MTHRHLVITGGNIVDGSGGPSYRGDILIRNGRIIEMGLLGSVAEAEVIDATGKYVTPGFIDIHRHCDNAVFAPGFGEMELAQGITTVVSGNCGLTPYPAIPPHDVTLEGMLRPLLGDPAAGVCYINYSAYAAALRERAQMQGVQVSHKQLIGSCSIRIAVKGFARSPFTPQERAAACRYIDEAMEHGALGLSMGLMYWPEYFTPREDLIALAKTAARRDGLLTIHMRNEGDSLPASVREAVQIAEEAEIPLEISHFKSCGTTARQARLQEAIDIIEEYRMRGVDIHGDFYPYTCGATTIQSLIPPVCIKDTPGETYAYMSTRDGAEALKQALTQNHNGWDNYLLALGFERVIISSVYQHCHSAFVGKTLRDVTDAQPGVDPYTALATFVALEQGQTGIFVASMSAEDVDRIAALPWTMVASDALYPARTNGMADTLRVHPRAYGTFPRVLSDMVRDRGVLTLPTAIRKMTALPAEKMQLANKGILRKGADADICVFDLHNIAEQSSYTAPPAPARGMDYVLRGGDIVYGEHNREAFDNAVAGNINHNERI